MKMVVKKKINNVMRRVFFAAVLTFCTFLTINQNCFSQTEASLVADEIARRFRLIEQTLNNDPSDPWHGRGNCDLGQVAKRQQLPSEGNMTGTAMAQLKSERNAQGVKVPFGAVKTASPVSTAPTRTATPIKSATGTPAKTPTVKPSPTNTPTNTPTATPTRCAIDHIHYNSELGIECNLLPDKEIELNGTKIKCGDRTLGLTAVPKQKIHAERGPFCNCEELSSDYCERKKAQILTLIDEQVFNDQVIPKVLKACFDCGEGPYCNITENPLGDCCL